MLNEDLVNLSCIQKNCIKNLDLVEFVERLTKKHKTR